MVIFLFNQSKNNAVLGPVTEHFRGLVGVKAKDLIFEAKAKDFKCVLLAKDVLEDSNSNSAL